MCSDSLRHPGPDAGVPSGEQGPHLRPEPEAEQHVRVFQSGLRAFVASVAISADRTAARLGEMRPSCSDRIGIPTTTDHDKKWTGTPSCTAVKSKLAGTS